MTAHTILIAAFVTAFASAPASQKQADRLTLRPNEGTLTVLADLSLIRNGGSAAVLSAPLHGVMVHGFVAELVNGAGVAVASGTRWQATLESAGGTTLIRLSEEAPSLSVPRPLGILGDGDSLLIRIRVAEMTGNEALRLRLTIRYDPPDAPLSRFPVVPMRPLAATAANADNSSWEFQPTVDGRLMAVVGARFQDAGQLTLQEVESGVVIWRASIRSGAGLPAFAQPHEILRVGVSVEAGVRYRLIVTGPCRATDLIAMVLPNQLAMDSAPAH
jgi:hypothetical protein